MKTVDWVKFFRQYGPSASNGSMYDETIQRLARRTKVQPLVFQHPHHDKLMNIIKEQTTTPTSVILTGTAGDGKTHLCREAWKELGGDAKLWGNDDPYLLLRVGSRKIHFLRDLSAWAPQQGSEWLPEKAALLEKMCTGLFQPIGNESFILAANDGQLVETWRRLPTTEIVIGARQTIEELLVNDHQDMPGVRLKLLNMSRTSSAMLFDSALDAFLSHPGWEELRSGHFAENEFGGSRCPIRHNFELLQSDLLRRRLRTLLELCDHNGLHLPIRQILLLLANSILGHPDVKEQLMLPDDVPKIIAEGTVSKASIYSNIFGANLSDARRHASTIFDYMERFQVGYETSNRIDNLLIFGEEDENLGGYFDALIKQDKFYGADTLFYAAKREYIEGVAEEKEESTEFLDMLVAQRRALFFKIPPNIEDELHLWELTVFKFAGDYLNNIVNVLRNNGVVKRPIISRLVKGLNRVFTGMLVNSEHELCLATSGNYSQAKVCRILVDTVSVEPSKGEKILLRYDPQTDSVLLSVFFSPDKGEDFRLTLIRYEFLMRISTEGAMPASFSKECYEDLLTFKSRLIDAYLKRQAKEPLPSKLLFIKFLSLTEEGTINSKRIEIIT